jgi:hypothetical protein
MVKYRELPGNTNHIIRQSGGEEVAGYSLEWATSHVADYQIYN